MAANQRSNLVLGPETLLRVAALHHRMRQLFGRSLRLRQVSAAGCVACEADANVLAAWEVIPSPPPVIASGACAISGGPFAGHPEVHDGVSQFLPVDLFAPGCLPHPLTLLDGLLRLLGRIENRKN